MQAIKEAIKAANYAAVHAKDANCTEACAPALNQACSTSSLYGPCCVPLSVDRENGLL